MIIYNVTVKVEYEIEQDWLDWMKNVHIPEVMKTNCFQSYKMLKLLMEDPEGTNYAIQYFCENMEKMNEYNEKFAPSLKEAHANRYKDKFIAFRTLLEDIS
jgi:hypothetical protein